MTNMAMLYYTRTLAPGVMTFTILLESSLFFIIMYSLCLLNVHRHKFYSCYPQIKAFLVESHEIYISLQMQYTKDEDYIGTIAFEMKLLMNEERQCE